MRHSNKKRDNVAKSRPGSNTENDVFIPSEKFLKIRTLNSSIFVNICLPDTCNKQQLTSCGYSFQEKIEIIFSNKRKIQLDLPNLGLGTTARIGAIQVLHNAFFLEI